MSTPTTIAGSQLIKDALVKINVIREDETPTAEQQANAIRTLNEMMATWEVDGISLGYIPIGTVTNTLTVPDGAIKGIKCNLAIALASDYGASVSPELAREANDGMAAVYKLAAKMPSMQLDVAVPSDWLFPRDISSL